MTQATFSPDSLWSLVQATTQQALQSGALAPIATQTCVLTAGELAFTVRVVDSLARKEAARSRPPQSAQPFNPFLPYEEALFVASLSETHVCLLNKFNVVDHHLLMVTRQYESQDDWLTQQDFAALARCLIEIEGLGFYNGGAVAGSSQPHKHLQLVPLMSPAGTAALPITPAIAPHRESLKIAGQIPTLPFSHSIRVLAWPSLQDSHHTLTNSLLEAYQQIMADLGIYRQNGQPSEPYNLLVTRDWLMAVRRSQASYEGINVNSLGYAGWLLVKDQSGLDQLKQIGPLTLLEQVGYPLGA
ncbi:MAG: phosphorylase [Leptolyngbyaceae cyanobacterium]